MKDHLTIEIDEELLKKVREKSKTYKHLEEINKDLGGSVLLNAILKEIPINYTYKETDKTDKELWYEEVREKYEL